ncbi:MAG: hypothetical protein JHD03_08005 [Solirubrobacteraceae bacterium]|nr:hypothetical protein [Solirubrobacteraceae bacterium]MBJ7342774.1 hypothetical protein [Solirubrobacteraceae bacterium]
MSQELVVIEVASEQPRSDDGGGVFGLLGRVASFGVRSTGDAIEAVIGSDAVEESINRLLSSPAIERLIQTALSGPLVDALSRELVRQRVVERITTTLIEAGVFEPIIDAFLERPELWVLVEEIAQSPSVSDAIRQQSFGFADQVGDEVRGRSRSADDILARAARRLVGRRGQMAAQRPSDGDAHVEGENGDQAAAAKGSE